MPVVIYQRRDFVDFSVEVLNDILRSATAEAQSPISITVLFGAVPPDAVDILFFSNNALAFRVCSDYSSADRRNFFVNRWICTWPLFAEVKRRHPDLVGECRLWLDDNASGAGLAFCSNFSDSVLIPDSVYFETGGYEEVREFVRTNRLPWHFRRELIFWRGASTGPAALRVRDWRSLPRVRLCLLSRRLSRAQLFDVGLNQIVQIWDPLELKQIEIASVMRREVSLFEFSKYRYSIDIDGNTCSWPGLFTKLLMGNTIIKVASHDGFQQWYYDRLLPWRNYVPLSADLGEMEEIAEWLVTHPEEASAIGARGAALAAELTMDNVISDIVPRVRAMVATSNS